MEFKNTKKIYTSKLLKEVLNSFCLNMLVEILHTTYFICAS